MSWKSDIVINFEELFYRMECQPHLTRSLIFCTDRLMSLMCSFVVHMYRCAVYKISDVFKLIVTMEISDGQPPVLVLGLNFFYTR